MTPCIHIRPTTDLYLLHSIMTEPSVYEGISDDDMPAREVFSLGPVALLTHVFGVVLIDEIPAGYTQYRRAIGRVIELHGAILPTYRSHWRQIAKAAVAYPFDALGADKVVALCPAWNRPAQAFNRAAGMTLQGVMTGAHRKHGAAHDVNILAISRIEYARRNSLGDDSGWCRRVNVSSEQAKEGREQGGEIAAAI